MFDVPWPTSSNPGGAFGEGSGRLINCYAFKDGAALRWRFVPGLTPFATLPLGEIRGLFYELGTIIAVVGNAAVQINGGGNFTKLEGNVPGDGPVTIAKNSNAVTPAIAIATSNGAFVIENGVVLSYPDGDLPQVNDVAFLDGFFLFTTAPGAIWASGLNTTDIDPLSFANAEARLDGLLRGIVYGQLYFAFGTETIEVWQDVGALNFPLTRATVIPMGLLSQWAVAGFEDGWAGPLIFVGQDNSVRSLDGYTPNRISNDDLEGLIAAVPDKTDLRACVYTFGGNAIWSLSSNEWTWEYNVTTGQWHERQSYLKGRWRGARTVQAFDAWFVADIAGGQLYRLDIKARTEGTDPVIWGLDSGPVKQFPIRVFVAAAYFDFVLGQADVSQDDPQVQLSWSHDGGATWASPLTRTIGSQGRNVGRVAINRLGLSSHHGSRLRFRLSEPVYSSFSGAQIDGAARR